MNPRGLTILAVAWVLLAAAACGKSKSGSGGSGGAAAGGRSESSSSMAGGGSTGAGGVIIGRMDAGASPRDAGASFHDGGGSLDAPLSGGSTASSTGGRGGAGGSSSRNTGAGGSTSKPDAGTTGPCRIDITPVTESSLLNLAPGENRTLAVKGKIVWGTTKPFTPTWQWTVKSPDLTVLPTIAVTISESNTDSIQFPLLSPGKYEIRVSISQECSGSATATAAMERSQPFFLRVLPPPNAGPRSGQACGSVNRWCPSEDAVPYEEKRLFLEARLPKEVGFSLLKGHLVNVDPMQLAQPDPTAFPPRTVPSTIKVVPHNSTWTIDGASTNDRPFLAMMDSGLKYDVLVVPNASHEAGSALFTSPPFIVGDRWPHQFTPDVFSVVQGVTVRGTIRVAGAPLMGARVLLRAEASDPIIVPLPSTWGNSDALGAYSVRAHGVALFSVIVIPPMGTNLPQVTIPACLDLRNIPDGGTVGDVDFDWNTIALTNLSVTVMTSDGQSPVPSVQVRLQFKDEHDEVAPEPGKLTINGNEADSPKGNLRLEATTDQSGMVTFGAIPKAHYHLVLLPPEGLSDAAITAVDLDLRDAAGDERRMYSLSRKIKLTGRIVPPDSSSGGHMVAIDTGNDILGNSISATIQSDGSYTLMADPGRTYRFSVEPAPGTNLPTRIPLYGVTTPSQNARLADRSLPTGLKVSGTVKFSNKGVPGAIVQAYCQQSGMSGCVDPDNPSITLPPPLVEIATQADGSFVFYLLDPGTY